VSPGVGSTLRYLTPPTNTVAGEPFAEVVRVAVVDAYGNTVPSATNSVTLEGRFGATSGDCAYGSGAWQLKITQPGYYGCAYSVAITTPALGGPTTVAAVSGIASFPGLRPRFTEIIYLNATSPGLNNGYAVTHSLVVSPSAPHAVWVTGPNPGEYTKIANEVFTISAYILDSLHNQVNTGSNVISLAIGANPGAATLAVANNISATNGKANFNVSLSAGGDGFTLDASSAGLATVTSPSFKIAAFGASSRLGFAVQPGNATVGAPLAAVKVCVQDAMGNTVTTASNNITIAIGTNAGGATLGGTLTTAAASGCASFGNLTLSAAGTGYTLSATATSLTAAASTAFNVVP
jgi:hypothetical protein